MSELKEISKSMSNLPKPAAKIRIRQVALCTDDIWPVETAIARELEITPVHRDKPSALSGCTTQ